MVIKIGGSTDSRLSILNLSDLCYQAFSIQTGVSKSNSGCRQLKKRPRLGGTLAKISELPYTGRVNVADT